MEYVQYLLSFRGPDDTLQAKSYNELLWHNFELNQAKTKFFWSLSDVRE